MTNNKLLFIAPTTQLRAGGEVSNFELILAAKKKGYKIHVALTGYGKLAKELKNRSTMYTVIPFSNWGLESQSVNTGRLDFIAIEKIQTVIIKNNIDCVITNTLNMPWGALAAALTNTPHIWIAREFPLADFKHLENKYDFVDAFSNTIIANSKKLSQYMNTNYHLKSKYMYSYVDVSKLKLSKKISQTRLVNIGFQYKSKNQLDLIEAAGILHKHKKLNNKILLIGATHPTYKKQLDKAIKKHKLEDYVIFSGNKLNPYSLVGKNDIFVQTSLSESIGRTVVEAMKLGLVTIGANIDGNKEAFSLGGGVLYKSQDVADLAKKIDLVVNNIGTYKTKGILAQKKVLKNLSEKKCHQNFFIEIKKVFNQPNPQNHLRHILPYINNINDVYFQQEKELKNYQYHLGGILDSKSWQLFISIKKLFKK